MPLAADLSSGFVAVHDRHLTVHQDTVGAFSRDFVQCFATVARDTHGHSGVLEHVTDDFLVERDIVDEQNIEAGQARGIGQKAAAGSKLLVDPDAEEGGDF